MVFMAVIGKRFAHAGLRDVLSESEIVSSGSVDGVIKGSITTEPSVHTKLLLRHYFACSGGYLKDGSMRKHLLTLI